MFSPVGFEIRLDFDLYPDIYLLSKALKELSFPG